MLKSRKTKPQSKANQCLREENIRLSAENKELKEKLESQLALVEAAYQYRAEYLKALSALDRAKEKYTEATRNLASEKKKH